MRKAFTGHKILLNYSCKDKTFTHSSLSTMRAEEGVSQPLATLCLFFPSNFFKLSLRRLRQKSHNFASTGTSCCIFSVLSAPLPSSPSLTYLTSNDGAGRVGKWCDWNLLRVAFCKTNFFFTVLYLGAKLPNECCYRRHISWNCFQCEIKSLNWQN